MGSSIEITCSLAGLITHISWSMPCSEALIARKAAKFDLSKFEDGYEVAVKELVEAKIKHLPIPQDEVPAPRPSNVINLMDALRKSIGAEGAAPKPAKKPPVSVKEAPAKSMGLVEKPAKSAPKRKTA